MELHAWRGAADEHFRHRIHRDAEVAVQSELMHLSYREVHRAREEAFDEQALAEEGGNHVADTLIPPQRDERAEVPISERSQRPARETPFDLAHHV